jgi:hypothetical protein
VIEQDALMAVLAKSEDMAAMDEKDYRWRYAAIELVIKILYALGFEIRVREGR